ncbi:hypothetical protein FRC11_000811 [Ceratobasidium sp. 423]|nr:hypothetical protein FRC11_000811 [Ceratobasidium sp. 423]
MECDTEDEEFIPGVRDVLDAVRQATLSPPPPNASTSTLNPLVMTMATKLESIDFGLIASQNSEPLDGWSRLSLRLLSVIVDALSEHKPATNTSANRTSALVGVRMRLRQLMNAVDETADKLGIRLTHTCPNSCPASHEGTPAAPPPPAKTYADVYVEARPPSPNPTPAPRNPVRPSPAPCAPRKDTQALAPATATLPRLPANAGLPPKPTPAPPKPKTSAPPVSNPIRLVVRFGGNPPEELRGKPQTELFRKVSSMLDVHPTIKGVTILGAHWNRCGNIIISFPDDVPQHIILALRPGIRAALGIAESVAISIDTPWSKMLVSSVPARVQPRAPVFSEDDIAASFARNPEIMKLSITRCHNSAWRD